MANHLRLSLGIACAASLIVGCVPRPALPVTPPAASTSTTPATTTPDVSRPHPVPLVNQLRQGGYVLYIRHAKTDFAQKDTTSDYDDCTRQRNLTDEGRAQATAIGVAFKQLGIPVGRVVASPYCRTRETAQLAFGKFERATHYEVAKSLTHDLLAAAPAAGPNTIIVAHGFILRDIAHLLLNEGDAVVFKPRGNGDQNAIARVPAKLWTTWAAGDNAPPLPVELTLQEYDLPAGVYPHDVAPAGDSTVWFTAQNTGQLGRFDPRTGKTTLVALGDGSHPHGVIVGADGAAWVTDGGLNAIVRVDAKTEQVKVFPLPKDRANTNLNTAAFDANGRLWFTGQSGIYGRLDTTTGKMDVWDAPRGAGPYGITSTADGSVYFASLAGNYIARIDPKTGVASVIEPPTKNQGARRIWADSQNRVWVSEWNAGQLALYDPATKEWKEWRLPGGSKTPQAYAMYVDAKDNVWVSDFGNNSLIQYSPRRKEWVVYPLPSSGANVRQLLGQPLPGNSWGEVWGAESGAGKLVVVRAE